MRMEEALLKAITGDDSDLEKALQDLGVTFREREAFMRVVKETEGVKGDGSMDGLLAQLEALAEAKMEEEAEWAAEEQAMEGLQEAEESAMRDTYKEEEADICDEDFADEEALKNLEDGKKEKDQKDMFDRHLKTGDVFDISSD